MSERDQRKLQELIERRLGIAWSDIMAWLRETNSVEEIERRMSQGLSPLVGVEEAAAKLADELHDAYVTSGKTQAAWIDRRVDDSLVRFDTGDSNVVRRQRQNELAQIQGLTAESRDNIRQALVDQAQTGANPREVARRIRDSIGLTPQQEEWVANYRRALESQDWGKALGYELSSGRADASVRAAERRGEALKQERIDRMVEEYRQNAITMRAETIARTESQAAVNQGGRDSIQQAIDRGDVEAGQMVTEWHAGPSGGDARPEHQAMNGVVVRFGEDFILPDGTRMSGPGDPRGGAEHNANCRCTSSVRMMEVPDGFKLGGKPLNEGRPTRDTVDEGALYSLTPDDIRGRLRALPGGGDDQQRMDSIRSAWEQGRELPPVDLAIDEDGNLLVDDGRHRLLVALEQGRGVLARIGRAAPGAAAMTVPL